MIRDSSDEEEDEEEEEEEEPIDFAAEAAKTAARSMARSASLSYLKGLLSKCQEAVGDPELQRKQLQALDDLVAKYPEMANKSRKAEPKPEPTATEPTATTERVVEVAEDPGSPASAQSVLPASPVSPLSPQPPENSKRPVKRGKEKEVGTPTPKSPVKASPKRQVKAKSGSGQLKQAQSLREFTEEAQAAAAGHSSEVKKKASPNTTWSSKVSKADTGRFETTMRPSPKAISASSSLTQLPSGTWKGPVETSGSDREMFLRSLSKHESMPLLTFRPRRGKDLWVTNVSNPAPGTYPDLDESHTSKYLAPRQVSFGFSRKGSKWPANAEQKPGPGAHSVVNFERFKYAEPVRHSFGAAARGRPNPIRQSGPGPGAYGIQRADEDRPAVTMVGKYRKRGVLSYDDPGPGAYDPTIVLCAPTAPSVGFATSLRQDFYPKEDKGIPAPGTYDVMKQNPVGSDCLAFSMAGKRKRHDLTAHLYAGPGPGFYNHGSTFGYRSTWHAPPMVWAPPVKNLEVQD